MNFNKELVRKRFLFTGLIRDFFQEKGYLEVETPSMAPYATLDANIQSFETEFYGKKLYFQTSPEYYMKELTANGFEKTFQICRAFRQGELSRIHNPEFSILEWYCTGHDYHYMMSETEELVFSLMTEKARKRFTFPVPRVRVSDLFKELSLDLENLEITEEFYNSVKKLGIPVSADDSWDDLFFRVMVSKIEPSFAGKSLFLMDYPERLGAMARPSFDNPAFAERFELYLDGIEICNGFSELTDPQAQKNRFLEDLKERTRRNLPLYSINDRFLSALDKLPPCTGNALGIDRLFQVLNEEKTIHTFLPFSLLNHQGFEETLF